MRLIFTTIFLLVTILSAYAEVPQTINYQGHLAGTGGAPVNAAVDMTFTIYNAATNGTNLWTEGQTVQVNNGIYAVALGAIIPIDPAMIDGDLWLGVKVETDAEMTPRQKLNSVPFASRSAQTDDPVLVALQKKERGDFSYFIEHGDGTVTDPTTGLMWLEAALGGYNWYQASGTFEAAHNASSDDVCGSMTTGGHNDWRLPNANDVLSLTAQRWQTFDPVQAPGFPLLSYVDGTGAGNLWLGALYYGSSYDFNFTNFALYDGWGTPPDDTVNVKTTCVRLVN